jgi:hypothetical protein
MVYVESTLEKYKMLKEPKEEEREPKNKIFNSYIDQVKHLKWKNQRMKLKKYARDEIKNGFFCVMLSLI